MRAGTLVQCAARQTLELFPGRARSKYDLSVWPGKMIIAMSDPSCNRTEFPTRGCRLAPFRTRANSRASTSAAASMRQPPSGHVEMQLR